VTLPHPEHRIKIGRFFDALRDIWNQGSSFDHLQDKVKLIIGLGNPGKAYENNRHNVGFRCLEQFARTHGLTFKQRQSQAYVAMGRVAGQPVILAKPQTFMNRSGQAVACLVHYYRVPLHDVLIVYDDLDLPLGKLRIRERGSAGGHNGMRSIIASLGTHEVPRLRLGIGRPEDHAALERRQGPAETEVIRYVLSDFTAAEQPIVAEMCQRATEAIHTVITEGLTAAMNRYNRL